MAGVRRKHDAAVRAVALKMHLEEGKSVPAIGRALGVPTETVRTWLLKDNPARRVQYAEGTREELSALIYETVLETLKSLTARAKATARADWIGQQDAHSLAQLDATQWDRVLRVIHSFRTPAEAAEVERAAATFEDADFEPPRALPNGTVDSTA